ncbi:peptidoglycan DD-metalloendopeptidase family protein [Lysobacter sp. D1-1-M9]|uniref:peptidoglycan DD-metalloendopeptidase family protein n=1 Tax=Novilysobacter longmucuonensis TaxID=3098603 RepID=UPI002FCA21A5
MDRPRHLTTALCALAFAVASGGADAGKVYRWTDRNGVTHYGDRMPDAPPAEVSVIPVRAEPSAIARLRLEKQDGRTLVWADNRLDGPIEVLLRIGRGHVASEPELPATATVPPHGSAVVAVLTAAQHAELQLDALPGDPDARPLDTEYLLPLQQSRVRVHQGFAGRFSHADPQNRYAADFAAAIGTPVVAARAGRVMQIESDFDQAGLDRERYGGRANFVRVLHEDGTMALYAHLDINGVHVRVGEQVRAGQRIGLSGNTGFTTGPHLHFAVQVNRGMRLEAISFRMRGVSFESF